MQLPNGQSFLAKYEGTSRRSLPRNVTVKRKRKIGQRKKRRHKAAVCSVDYSGQAKNKARNKDFFIYRFAKKRARCWNECSKLRVSKKINR